MPAHHILYMDILDTNKLKINPLGWQPIRKNNNNKYKALQNDKLKGET